MAEKLVGQDIIPQGLMAKITGRAHAKRTFLSLRVPSNSIWPNSPLSPVAVNFCPSWTIVMSNEKAA